jgi:hypothetical protein
MRIKQTWQNYWKRHKNHPYGMCFVNHKLKKFYINIPKCATNWGKNIFNLKLEWEESNYLDTNLIEQGYEAIVFLRDPIDRWISGMAEYVSRYGYNTATFISQLEKQRLAGEIINTTIAFDEHTVEQITFLEGLDTNTTIWFRVDADLNQNVSDYCQRILGIENNFQTIKPRYTTTLAKAKIKNWFEENVGRFRNLTPHYKLDTELYNSVKYYIREDKD